MLKVSVIMPVYNAEKYLESTLKSILAQTLTEFELICVDDGSTDGSGKVIQQYAASDERLRVIMNNNHGAGHARNVGLENAQGEYLFFFDADDIVMPTMLAQMYDLCSQQDLDMLVCRHKEFKNGKFSQAYLTHLGIKESLLPKRRPFQGTDIHKDFFNAFVWWPWDKFFRREFILDNELRFQESRTTNDLYFVVTATLSAVRINCLNEALICHRVSNPVSLEGTRMKSSTCFIEALSAIELFLRVKGIYERFKQDFLNYCLGFSLWQIETLPRNCRHAVISKIKIESWFQEIRNQYVNYFYRPDEYRYMMKLCQDYSSYPETRSIDEEKENRQGVCELAEVSKKDRCLLSVIIAAACDSNMLEECLESLKLQNISDMEIICVLYGAAADEGALLELMESKKGEFTIIVSNGASLMEAWQLGYRKAKGNYTWFCHGCDYVLPLGLKKLCDIAEKKDLDLLLFEAEAFGTGSDHRIVSLEADKLTRQNIYSGVYSGQDLFCRIQSKKDYLEYIDLCLIRKDLLMDNKFDFRIELADRAAEKWFFFQMLMRARQVACLSYRPYQKRILPVIEKVIPAELVDTINLAKMEEKFAANVTARVAAAIKSHVKEIMNAAEYRYQKLSTEEKRELTKVSPSIQRLLEDAWEKLKANNDEECEQISRDAYKQPEQPKSEKNGDMLVYGCGAHLEDMLDWNPDLKWRISRIFDKNKDKIGTKLPRIGKVVEPPSALKQLPAGTEIAISAIRYFDEISKEIREINPKLICWDIDEYHERLGRNIKATPKPAPASKPKPAPASKPTPVKKLASPLKNSAFTVLQRQRMRGREAAMRWRQSLLMESVTMRHVFWGVRGERAAFLARRFASMMIPGDIFIDEDMDLCGRTQMGLPVCQPKSLDDIQCRFIIIVLSENYAHVRELLLDYGYVENVNFVEGRTLLGEDEHGFIHVPCIDKPRSGMIVYGWGAHIEDMLHWHPALKNRIARVIDKDPNKVGMKLPVMDLIIESIDVLKDLPSGTEIAIAAIRYFNEIRCEINALHPGLICRNIDKIWEEYI